MANTIIRASAGSGKTYQLSNSYLQQIFDAPTVESALDSILASTFTRKAAGEITDRIFTKFADIALDEAERKKLSADLRFPNKLETIRECLADLAKNMYRMRVGTLDSYFNKIASAFSLELGLPPGWSIISDPDFKRLLIEAVRDVFEESDRNGARQLMHLLQKGQSEATIIDNLVWLAMNILPLIRETKDEAWEHDVPGRLKDLTSGMMDSDRLHISVALLEKVKPPSHKSFQKELTKLHAMFYDESEIKSVDAVNWKTVLGHGLIEKVIANIDTYYSTTIADDIIKAVKPLSDHAKAIQIKLLIDQTTATRDLLKLVAEKLDRLMVRDRKFRYEDITRKVAEYKFNEERLQSLNHRLNGNTRHLLLDEFQDTSIPQWDILRPLAERVAQDEHGTFFCVGDVKQSIYSWRGGVAAVFDTMKQSIEDSGAAVKEESMDITRRCRPQVVETVNIVFQNIQDNKAVLAASPKAGIEWQKRFKRHKSHEINEAGYCALEESPIAVEGENKADVHLQYVVNRIAELASILDDRPKLKHGIGILVSSNKIGARIVAGLKRRGIEVNGGGGSLADSVAVRYILSAMTLADHPGNTIARFHLVTSPLKDMLGLTDDSYLEKYGDVFCSQNIRRDLSRLGYGATVKKYANILAPFCDPHEFLRLEKLLELAYSFDEEVSGVRTKTFVEKVENTTVSSPDAANITVTTIHGAKGLEYDIVVLPQLDFDMTGAKHTPELVVDHTDPDNKTTPVNFVLRYPNTAIQKILPDPYKKVFERRIQGEVEESLSELYVAMTRAIYQLVMIVPPKGNDFFGTTFEGVLRNGLMSEKRENVLFDIGDEHWFEKIERKVEKKTKIETVELTCEKSDRKVHHHVSRIVPSSLHKKVEKAADDKILGHGPVWGTAMHACFEHGVEWLDKTNEIGDETLCEIVADAIRDETYSFTPEEVVAQFRRSCKEPEIVKALSRSRYSAPDVTVERERKFAVWVAKETTVKIMHGSVDRLVALRDGTGKITEIEVLDYKSDVASDVQTLVDAYRDQLEAYRQGIAALFKIGIEKVKATLVFVSLGKIITL